MSTWIKVYNSLPAHPKIIEAGDRAAWLFICGLCYCNEHATDGKIDRRVLPALAPGVRSPEKLAERLVRVVLWEATNCGWLVHEYLEFQRSADEIKKHRAAAADRQRRSRSRHAEVTP